MHDAVDVTGAAGYENFSGYFLGEFKTLDGRLLTAVGFETSSGVRDFVVVSSACVSRV